MVACDPPKANNGGDNGGNDGAPRTVRFEKTIIGLREFLLTVTAKPAGTYEFILSNSAAVPDWTSVKDKPALIKRSFSADKNHQREIYFSLTDAFTGPAGHLINADSNEAEQLKRIGFMGPATQYYVHAYRDGVHVASSEAITTVGYPTSFPQTSTSAQWTSKSFPANPYRSDGAAGFVGSYTWAMGMWLSTDESARRTIEVRRGENYYLPLRMVAPSTRTGAVGCISSQIDTLSLNDVRLNTSETLASASFAYPQVSQAGKALVLKGKNGIQSDYYDLMAPVILPNSGLLSSTGPADRTTADRIVRNSCAPPDPRNPQNLPMHMSRRVISYRIVPE